MTQELSPFPCVCTHRHRTIGACEECGCQRYEVSEMWHYDPRRRSADAERVVTAASSGTAVKEAQ